MKDDSIIRGKDLSSDCLPVQVLAPIALSRVKHLPTVLRTVRGKHLPRETRKFAQVKYGARNCLADKVTGQIWCAGRCLSSAQLEMCE